MRGFSLQVWRSPEALIPSWAAYTTPWYESTDLGAPLRRGTDPGKFYARHAAVAAELYAGYAVASVRTPVVGLMAYTHTPSSQASGTKRKVPAGLGVASSAQFCGPNGDPAIGVSMPVVALIENPLTSLSSTV